MAAPDNEVDGFLSPKEEQERDEAKKGKARLPKFVPPQPFDGTMKETKSFISSLILYIYGRKAEFLSNELKIMFVLSYIQSVKYLSCGRKLQRSTEGFLRSWQKWLGFNL